MATKDFAVFDADSHVVEPLDLWQERLPVHLRERAPRRIEQDGRWVFLIEGMAPKKMGSPSDDAAAVEAAAAEEATPVPAAPAETVSEDAEPEYADAEEQTGEEEE